MTKSLSGSIRTGLRPLQSEEGAGTGSGPKNAYRAVIPEAKPIAQIPGERQLPQKTEGKETKGEISALHIMIFPWITCFLRLLHSSLYYNIQERISDKSCDEKIHAYFSSRAA